MLLILIELIVCPADAILNGILLAGQLTEAGAEREMIWRVFGFDFMIDRIADLREQLAGRFLTAGMNDEDEFVSATRMPLTEAVARVMDGTLRDAKTALGILMAAQKRLQS